MYIITDIKYDINYLMLKIIYINPNTIYWNSFFEPKSYCMDHFEIFTFK